MDTKLQQLFQVLRWCGAAMIVAASGTFLIQSWDGAGDASRYLTLLGMTALLPAVAYLCGIRLKESRSARVLVLTFLALLPIHAALLGGFVLSQFGTVTSSVTSVAQWVAPSRSGALLLVGAAAIVLVPLVWASFRVLSRPTASTLAACTLASHGLLLIPDRGALTATLSILPITALASWAAARTKPRTLEAWLAVASLAAPGLVIAARQLMFYQASSAFWGTLLGCGAAALFVLGKKIEDVTVERTASVPLLLSIAAFVEPFSHGAASLSNLWLGFGLLSAAALLPLALLSGGSRSFFVRTAVLVNAVTSTTTLLVDPGPWAALQAIAIGLGLLSYGFVTGRRPSLYTGVGLACFGFIIEVVHAVEVFEPSGWLALASFGVALVGLTAWLERRASAARGLEADAKLSQPAPMIVPR